MSVPTIEGFAPYDVPAAGKPCQTWYKVVGNLNSGKTPLIVLHGGPGATHQYMLSVADLAQAPYNLPVVFYDQIGCGNSTRLTEKLGDAAFWTVQLFVDEFHNLLKHLNIETYDVLGQSWGSMLAQEIAVRQPAGLRRLVLSSGPASMKLWAEGTARLLKEMPEDIQGTIRKHESAGTFLSPEYQQAIVAFNKKFVCRLPEWPAEITATFDALESEPAAYLTMQGPSEFTITGSLKEWSIIPELHKINVPTLATNGAYDEAQDSVIAPIFKHVPKIKWYTFSTSAHMAHFEQREKFMEIAGEFLTQEI